MDERPEEMDERDVDARFASIVAAWESGPQPPAEASGTDPEPVDPTGLTGEEPPGDGEPATDGEDARPPWVNPSPVELVLGGSRWRAPDPETGAPTPLDEEHFEPPAVQLPPQEDLHFWGAVVGLVAGPLCLLYVALARPFHSTRWFLAGVGLSLLGFVLLVLRQPRHRDEDDDGARV
ncbi:hypothetical protein H9L10_06850 [Phycicoccus endophyticus]|uniref:DUF308 domain-containing protein n=1 Tax=Phycicoccus endophyticus TaxID=1690220 RepID=A0A7G9R4Y0_9MICO|nr:hypothetical protein [Phycicoccus endophyticus]NHI18588.1 hypothetical protein [Phycicoccus endophyticus]QNN50655.1 hypothetical protein H9L10_06850 [Phycicoccus endophyticus]GGL22643.1 hypothetical protein GCM10012283_00850 [Phycicoccus endophyticus]